MDLRFSPLTNIYAFDGANFVMNWDDANLSIKSEWQNVSGNIEEALNDVSDLHISKYEYVLEWSFLFCFLKSIIISNKISGINIDVLDKIEICSNLMIGPSKLYKRHT